ncbi:MAG: hypothetical protein WDO72_08465 [Pseudomonadota bacterium]
MLERDVRRKYQLELGASMAAYIAVLFGSLTLAKTMEVGALRTAVLLTPMIPIGFAIWVIARQFRRMDEFVRLRSLEGLAIAAAVTAGLSLTYGFLEGAGFPRLSMFWVWPVMGFVWGAFQCVRNLASR